MDNNGWETYSKLVLKQLETLAGGIEALRNELQLVQNQLTELKAKEDKVQDLKVWKEKMDEVSSPTQLRELFDEVNDLKEFRTKSVTIFMVVQSAMGFAIQRLELVYILVRRNDPFLLLLLGSYAV